MQLRWQLLPLLPLLPLPPLLPLRPRLLAAAAPPQPPPAACSCPPRPAVRAACSTSQQRDYESPNQLLEVRAKGRTAELKSVSVNPAAPHLLAVAASDPLLRIYDRRMLTPGAGAGAAPGAL